MTESEGVLVKCNGPKPNCKTLSTCVGCPHVDAHHPDPNMYCNYSPGCCGFCEVII